METETNNSTEMVVSSIFVGKRVEYVQELCRYFQIKCRKTRVDDTNFFNTCDYNSHRINLEVDGGIVTSATLG
jgi:hypothetical protein